MIYWSHYELTEQGVDTKHILDLIDEKETKDQFTHEDDNVQDPTEPVAKEKCKYMTVCIIITVEPLLEGHL